MPTRTFTVSVVLVVSGRRVLVSILASFPPAVCRVCDHPLMSFPAISFVSSEADQEVLQKIQERFTVAIPTLPDVVDPATYMTS